jgi:hypothetical protein
LTTGKSLKYWRNYKLFQLPSNIGKTKIMNEIGKKRQQEKAEKIEKTK